MIQFLKVVSNDLSPCSYLEGRMARLPLALPVGPVSTHHFDQLMEAGYRRSGPFFYKTQCPNCAACEPLRLNVQRFVHSRTHRRTIKRAEALRCEFGEPTVDNQRVVLFNRHRQQRQLARHEIGISPEDYFSFLMGAPNDSIELSVWLDERLISISITDIGHECLSAVYCCFDPSYSHYSLGTLSILKQIELANSLGMRWLYLGLYVAANSHLNYKARYKPHQRLINDTWQSFE